MNWLQFLLDLAEAVPTIAVDAAKAAAAVEAAPDVPSKIAAASQGLHDIATAITTATGTPTT